MKKWYFFIGVFIATMFLVCPVVVNAEPSSEAAKDDEIKSDIGRADDWFTKPKDSQSNKRESKKEFRDSKTKERYVLLMNDNGFAYYLDTQSAKWKKIPYSESEDILDVWIRLVKTDTSGEYSYPQKYYLEHYYLRPKKKQVQFLSELEVTGRPNNAIRERSYSVRNWENLVPGSLEDEIYNGVLNHMKRDPFRDWFKHKSFRDEVEDKLRISL